ncbi:hypothetical protein BH10CYA1_BH10CYA1_40540 [soil metagenome]
MSVNSSPTEYDYGTNITYQNNQVYYGSGSVGSTVEYYDQAQALVQSIPASTVTTSNKKDWKPLGVYCLVHGTPTGDDTVIQLAVNKKGAIKGTYCNARTNEAKHIQGAVDRKGWRAVFTVGSDKNVIYDTGLSNLLKPQSPILIHFGKDKTQQWTLVKLQH